MIRTTAALTALLLATQAIAAQDDGSIPMPASNEAGTYDPELSAREATLASWALAVSGLRAGGVVSDKLVDARKDDRPYAALVADAQFAVKTVVVRTNAAHWLVATENGLSGVDPAILTEVVAASSQACLAEPCASARGRIADAFAAASAAFSRVSAEADAVVAAQEALTDKALMAATLTRMADYLDGEAWFSDLSLTDQGRNGEEVSARIVGSLAVWRNVEAYVGLTDAVVDEAVNAAMTDLLRDLRRTTRRAHVLKEDSPEIATIRRSAGALAQELRRAAALFEG